jgi:hypothetical protein
LEFKEWGFWAGMRKTLRKCGRSSKKATREQAKELAVLARMPDEKIDLTDAPEVREWRGAVLGSVLVSR